MTANETLPPVVDILAGSGLFARAFRDVGFPVVRGYEIDPARAAAWTANVGSPCEVRDVMTVTTADLNDSKDTRGRLVVIGGIPCQDWSSTNRHKREDPALRDRVLEVVRGATPVAVAIENVRAAWRDVPGVTYVRDADVGGYTIRERGFYGAPPVPSTHAEKPAQRLTGPPLPRWRGWGDAIPDYDYAVDMSQQDHWENRHALQVRPSHLPFWTITSKISSSAIVWKRASRKSLRWLTVDDAARLHGFPLDWTFPRGQEARCGCVGDAVPYAMGTAIALAIRERVNGRNRGGDPAPRSETP